MPRPSSLLLSCLALASLTLPAPAAAPRPTPLPARVDQLVAATRDFHKRAAPPASDAEFLRRAYLDLAGTIPTAAEARAFLADRSPGKRKALVERLLASPEHARRMALVFDVMLMERRPDRFVPKAAWHEYLRSSFAADKPWDVLAREVLSSDGADPKTRPAAKFYLDRAAEPHLLTRDVSRLFLGMNLQCAQCHDHPRIEEFKQAHYYGLFSFFNRTSLVNDRKLRLLVLSEKADGEVTYQSVFDPAKVTKSALPRVPGGPPVKDVVVEKGKLYLSAPGPGLRAVPRYSRRGQLGSQLARADYEPFGRNIANRLWALLMGRGLVHPLDMDHPGNPPSHPELLDLLANEVAARKLHTRSFLRDLALTKTYGRSSALPEGTKEHDVPPYAVAALKPLSPEQLAFALMQATGLTDSQRQALGKGATEATLYARLSPNVLPFVRAFGGQPGQPDRFDTRVDQALFLANGALVRSWLTPRAGNLTFRLAKLPSADAVAEELYLSTLTRLPDNEERKEVADFLAARKDRPAALQDLAWALVTSAEFRFNH
jgi:hypothetical protein